MDKEVVLQDHWGRWQEEAHFKLVGVGVKGGRWVGGGRNLRHPLQRPHVVRVRQGLAAVPVAGTWPSPLMKLFGGVGCEPGWSM